MREYRVRVGNTTIAIDANNTKILSNDRRRFEIFYQDYFICSIEVWGEHTFEEILKPAIQSEPCDTAQSTAE